MTPEETVDLLDLATQACPGMRMEDRTAEAWFLVLGQYDYTDCVAAIARIGAERTFISPADIAGAVRAARTARVDAANLIYEPAPDETPLDFARRKAAMIRAAADGNVIPLRPSLALPAGSGAAAPPAIADIVAEVRAERDQRSHVLSKPCGWCGAAVGAACEIPSPKGAQGRRLPLRQRYAHPSREQAARPAPQPEGVS